MLTKEKLDELIEIALKYAPMREKEKEEIKKQLADPKERKILQKKFTDKIKVTLIETKERIKNQEKYVQSNSIERVNTEENFKINLGEEVSSKQIFYKKLQLDKKIEWIRENIEKEIKNIKTLEEINRALKGTRMGIDILIAIGEAIPLLNLPLFIAEEELNLVSLGLDTAIQIIENLIECKKSVSEKLKKYLLSSFEIGTHNLEVIEKWILLFLENLKILKKLPLRLMNTVKFLKTFSIFYTLKQDWDSINDSNESIEQLNELEKEVKDEIKVLMKSIKQFKSTVTFVVIDETPQTDAYNLGGKGGKNVLFKNIKTNKNYTLEDMLLMTNEELYLYNLKKVYNSKLDEWYIRSLPNKTKEDNLG